MQEVKMILISLLLINISIEIRIENSVSSSHLNSNDLYRFNYDILKDEKDGKISNTNPITEITQAVLEDFVLKNDLIKNLYNKDDMVQFLKHLDEKYNDMTLPKGSRNPYHNRLHAADVVITQNKMLKDTGLCNPDKLNCKPHERLAIVLAAACHDYLHPGRSNNYFKDNPKRFKDYPLFEAYHDKEGGFSLEPFHADEALKKIEEYKLFQLLPDIEQFEAKELFRTLIINTDTIYDALKTRFLQNYGYLFTSNPTDVSQINLKKAFFKNHETRIETLSCILHSADISNALRPFDIFFDWSKMINQEFVNEGYKKIDEWNKKYNNPGANRGFFEDICGGEAKYVTLILDYFKFFFEAFPDLRHEFETNFKNNIRCTNGLIEDKYLIKCNYKKCPKQKTIKDDIKEYIE